MRLSVVVVTHLGGDWLRGCLSALKEQLGPQDELLTVVSAEPGTADLRDLPAGEVLDLQANPRFAAAANAGIARAQGAWILVLNDDTVPAPDFVEALLAAATEPGLYQPRILLADGSGRLDNAGHGLWPDGFNWARGREAPDGPAFEAPGQVGACSGAAFLIHREVIARVGAFDADLVAFGEDVDLSLRARRAGFPLRYVPQARIEHALGASHGRYGAEKVFWVERNRIRVALRSLPAAAVLTLPLWTGARLGLLAAARARGKGWSARVGPEAIPAALKGLAAGVACAPDALRKRAQDRGEWALGERAMWGHVWGNRVRWRELMR